MAEQTKSWAEMTYAEQETEMTRIARQEKYELHKAKLKALDTMVESSNIHVAIGAAQSYALLNGSLTSTSAPNRS